MTHTKENIQKELEKNNFPDLAILYSSESLCVAKDMLEELLDVEKKRFSEILTIPDTDINFSLFDEFSQLDYYFSLLCHYQGVHNDETIRAIIEDFEPQYIAFANEIAYSKRYYDMMYVCLEKNNLDFEQKRILEKSIEAYQLRGIDATQEVQKRLQEISQELSQLEQKFGNNALDSQKEFFYIIDDETKLEEMPENEKAIAQKKYQEKYTKSPNFQKGSFLFDASHSSYSSLMKYCSDAGIRKHMYQSRQKFASSGEYDNREIILLILRLREEKAHLLGKKTYAELALHKKMAESPDQVIRLIKKISQKAKSKAKQELSELRKHFGLTYIDVWDIAYYARKIKEEKYSVDERELQKYFELEHVKQGMFHIAEKLFGITYHKLENLSLYDEYVEVYEIKKDGRFCAYFLCDYYYNPLKRQGAWADCIRDQEFCQDKKLQKAKIVVNVCNFQQGADGKTLLEYRDVETLFHEFGHALHEMLSESMYASLTGFHVEHDFVEVPSQLMENWCRHRDGLAYIAKHHESGEGLSDEIISKLRILENYGSGYTTLKQNEYALLDMMLHNETPPGDVAELDQKVYKLAAEISLLPLGDEYKMHTTFTHIFDGGYAAGYYGYMWAEIIEKSLWSLFINSEDIFSPDIAQKLTGAVFVTGAKKDAREIVFEMIQKDLDVDEFLKAKGLLA